MNRILTIGLLALLALGGCRNKHNLTTGPTRDTAKEMREAQARLHEGACKFETLEIKGKGDYEDRSQKLSFNYRIRIVKSKAIWMSVTKLGLEGMRLLATPDSVFIMNKLESKVYATDYTYLSRRLGMPVDYAMLEDLLVGNFPTLSTEQITGYKPGPPASFGLNTQMALVELFIHNTEPRLGKIAAAMADSTQKSTLIYDSYTANSTEKLPFSLFLQIEGKNPMKVHLLHKEAELNPTDLRTPFAVPDDYQKVSPR